MLLLRIVSDLVERMRVCVLAKRLDGRYRWAYHLGATPNPADQSPHFTPLNGLEPDGVCSHLSGLYHELQHSDGHPYGDCFI